MLGLEAKEQSLFETIMHATLGLFSFLFWYLSSSFCSYNHQKDGQGFWLSRVSFDSVGLNLVTTILILAYDRGTKNVSILAWQPTMATSLCPFCNFPNPYWYYKMTSSLTASVSTRGEMPFTKKVEQQTQGWQKEYWHCYIFIKSYKFFSGG